MTTHEEGDTRGGAPARGAEALAGGRTGMSVGRLEAFSDGVFAIVITLLILEIKVPEPAEASGRLGHALAEQWPHYASFVLSFFVVGVIWLNHHATFNLLQRTDHRMQVLNLLLLLPVTVLPWPTDLLATFATQGTPGDQRLAVLVYGLASTAMGVAFNVLWRYLRRHPELHKPGVSPDLLAVRNRRFNVGVVVYPIATAIGLLSVPLFIALMLALALLYMLPTPDTRA